MKRAFKFGPFLLGLCLASALVFAQAIPATPYDTGPTIRTPTGVGVPTTFKFRTPANNTYYVSRVVQFTKARVGQLAKLRLATPYGLAIAAALAAVGMYYDSQDQQVKSNGSDGWPITTGLCQGTNGTTYSIGGTTAVTAKACYGYLKTLPGYTGTDSIPVSDTTFPRYTCGYNGGSLSVPVYGLVPNQVNFYGSVYFGGSSLQCQAQLRFTWKGDMQGKTPTMLPSAVPDQGIWDALFAEDAPFTEPWKMSTIEDLTWNPFSQRPNPLLAENVATATDIDQDNVKATDADPLTNPSKDLANDTGLDNMTDVVPPPVVPPVTSNPPVSSVPEATTSDICAENPDIFACIDVDELEDVDIPEQELDIDYSPVSLTMNATCPVSQSSSLASANGKQIKWDNEPMCEFLESSSGFVIAICAMIGACIVGAAVRS